MKKTLFLVAAATLVLLSCQKEIQTVDSQTPTGKLTFRASVEQPKDPATKGDLNSSNQLVWAEGDKIGIYFPDWGDKNQPFLLNAEDVGKTSGSFTIASAADPTGATASAAFYPWNASGTYPTPSENNVYDGIAYFKLNSAYWSYTSGKMLTPLVAPVTSSTDNISFKHAGAAVKLTVNNLASGTYAVGMSVTDKQITGDFHVNPANAGTDALALDATEDKTKNKVTLNTWKSTGAFTWIFPVPELTTPKLSFEILDKNGIPVWDVNLKAQTKNVSRGQILVMPAIDITPYEDFVQDNVTWTFSGNISGSAWMDDVPMVTNGRYWILSGFTFKAGDEFKIRKNNAWDEAYPSSNWVFTSDNAGSKDIIFDSQDNSITVITHDIAYPTVVLPGSGVTIDGDMLDWASYETITSTGTSRIRSWKFTSDDDNLYFYFVLRKNKMRTKYKLSIGLNWDNSGSYSADNLSGLEALIVFQPFTNDTAGTPACVDGTLNDATVNGSAIDNAGITVYGSDPDSSATGSSADYYIELSIPRAKIPDLPAKGTAITAGAGYEWYNTSLQDITL